MAGIIRVAAAALNQTPLDWDGNAERIRQAVSEARIKRVGVLCLPELCITGYGCEDAFLSLGTCRTAALQLERLVPDTQGMVVAFGLPILHREQLYNGAALAVDGQLVGIVGKQNLAGDGLHYEPRWFHPWPNNRVEAWDRDGMAVPLGDLLFDIHGVRLGFEICEDAWVLQRPGTELARGGVDLLLNPSASHFAFGKHAIREQLVCDGSRAFGAAYIYANLIGNEAGRSIYDGDCLIASEGRILAAGPRLGYRDVYLTTADIDLDAIRASRLRERHTQPDWEGGLAGNVSVNFAIPRNEVGTTSVPATTTPWEDSKYLKEEEFTR
ncbi:MAG TPA: nitrilase-related carbon-nitrogen hydrolase, partial [Pirellulaceae bacterium]